MLQYFYQIYLSGTSVNSYYGKRSLPDGEEDGLDYNWLRIIEILHEMDEHFRRLGVIQTNENDCRKRLICKLFENDNTKNSIDENEQKLKKLASQLRYIECRNDITLSCFHTFCNPFFLL